MSIRNESLGQSDVRLHISSRPNRQAGDMHWFGRFESQESRARGLEHVRPHCMFVRGTRLFLTGVVRWGCSRIDILEEEGVKPSLVLLGTFRSGAAANTFGLGFEEFDKTTPPLIRWEVEEQLFVTTDYDYQSVTVEIERP